jgi:RNA polymerase sigma-70 factor (ECF subfamily)
VSPPVRSALSDEFKNLFDTEFAYVCRSLQRLGVRHGDVLDVAQELFVAVHERLVDFDRTRPVRPWLFSFSLKFASNYRRLARNKVVEIDTDSLDAAPANMEARQIVLRALTDLDFDRRIVLVMHDLEGFAAPEIAVITTTPLNTVYSRLRLARADFRAAVTRLGEGERGRS